jgi:hypothetical protein
MRRGTSLCRFASATALAICLPTLAATAQTFDLSADFSLKKNPKGVWRYGYSAAQSLTPADFRLDRSSDGARPIGFWHPELNQGPGPGYYPYVAFNRSNQTEYGSSNGWAARPGEVAMEASNIGQFSIVRFVAPKSGLYQINARFAGIHFGLSTTDVHVMHNDVSLFDADIEGYGGDPAFDPVQGAQPNAEYEGTVELRALDVVDFAVGYGTNGTHFSHTTGLFAVVRVVK